MSRKRVLQFEKRIALHFKKACLVLGLSLSGYMKYRCEARPLPAYIELHMETLEALPDDLRQKIIKRRT